MDYVGGFTVVNDVSSRGLCAKGGAGQWGIGKNYDSELHTLVVASDFLSFFLSEYR